MSTAFTYYRSPFERVFGVALVDLIDRRLVACGAVVAAALLLVATIGCAQWQRLRELDARLGVLQAQASALQADARAVQRLNAAVVALRLVRSRVREQQRTTLLFSNAVAELGNDVPTHTWLTGIQPADGSAWTIDGRSTRFDEIGALLSVLARRVPAGGARLTSIRAGSPNGGFDFVLGWAPPT